MKKISGIIFLTLLLVLVSGILSACGTENAGSPQEDSRQTGAAQENGGETESSKQTEKGTQETSEADKQDEDPVVNVYTARHYEVDEELYSRFTEETGIRVNVVKGKAPELIERLKREGSSTEADLFVTVDGGVLQAAKDAGVLQPMNSDVLEQNVPDRFRDSEYYWTGISTRARVIVYRTE